MYTVCAARFVTPSPPGPLNRRVEDAPERCSQYCCGVCQIVRCAVRKSEKTFTSHVTRVGISYVFRLLYVKYVLRRGLSLCSRARRASRSHAA